ncbi:MAG TPA: carboxypeptidase regulatory-like domain-containing protein [Terracidiphilus sp.]|jgi:Carboxypeptidase regulatory-like domain
MPSLLKQTQRPSGSILATIAVAFCFLAFTGTAFAQRYLGSISGEVSDTNGAKIPGATVVAEETTTHFKTTAAANASGAYSFPSLNPGTYTVSLTAQGFKSEARAGVILTAGQLQEVDFQLTAGAVSETVTVTADNALLDTGSAQIATTLSTKEVTDLPNIGRNPFVLATLAAGVINTGSGGYFQGKASQFTQPFSGVAVQITSDGSSGHNRLTLDGIPDDPAERFSGASYTGFVPSPEAVEEVNVGNSIFDAQIGHGNGTVTNTVVRSGTNKLHGAAYYVFQNTYLNANTYEKVPNQNSPIPSVQTPRNNDQLSQTGFVVNGPVVIPRLYDGRGKTFFMVAFERYASHTAVNYSARVPTAAEIGGDFSGLCNTFNSSGLCTSGIQLYQPNSPVDANGNRIAYFPNNNIASAITPAGAALISYLPAPNVPGAAITGTNYISNKTSYPSTYPSFIARFDQAIRAKNKLNAIFFRSGLTQTYPLEGFPKGIGPVNTSTGFGYSVYRNNQGGSLDDVYQISSSMVLDSRFGLIYHPFGLVYPGSQNFDLLSLGITSNGFPYNSFPGESSSDGYAGLAPGAGGQISEDTTGSLEEILTKSLGPHTIRFGFEGNLIRYNVQNPQSGLVGSSATNPGFTFDRRFTQQNSVTTPVGSDPNSGDPMASLLLGYASTANYSINAAYALQQIYMAPFIQDDWRVASRLTVNLGLRYDYESPFTERYNRQASNFCTTCSNPLQGSVTGLTLNGGLQYTSPSNRFPYPRDLNNVQPRLGASFQATPTTVFRAGFGIIYFNTLETPIGTGFSQSTSYNNYVTSAPVNTISNPFPAGVLLPTGSSLGLSTALGQNITFIDPHHVQPKSAQYSASVQQQFAGNIALQIAYVGSRAARLEVNHNINVLPAQYYNQGPAEIAFLNRSVPNPMAGKIPQSTTLNAPTVAQYLLLLPYPEFGTVTEDYSSIGSSPYNGLQIQVSRPMKNHFSIQGNFTWDKLMLRNAYLPSYTNAADQYSAAIGKLQSVQDANPTMFGNIFAVVGLPKFLSQPAYQRLLIGGWQLNSVIRMTNGPLVSAPGGVDIIGDYRQPNQSLTREFNTCYQTQTIVSGVVNIANVNSTYNSAGVPTVVGCDAQSPSPAFRQRLAYSSQSNSTVLNVREPLYPVVDASLFKQFTIREGVSFEIRGEFFNILNTPNFGGPSTTLGAANAGSAASASGLLTQANDARIGQLTGRINF